MRLARLFDAVHIRGDFHGTAVLHRAERPHEPCACIEASAVTKRLLKSLCENVPKRNRLEFPKFFVQELRSLKKDRFRFVCALKNSIPKKAYARPESANKDNFDR